MRVTTYLRGLIWGFRKEERGSVAVEAIILLPLVFWTYLALYAAFHSYRTYATHQKAGYTIGDMISRETNPIDGDYMDGARELLAYLTAVNENNVALRVTSVKYDANNQVYKRDWSQARGFVSAVNNSAVAQWNTQLPILPHNERVVVVETFQNYDAPFNTGLRDRQVHNFVFTKPRYAPQVLWSND